MLMAQRHRRTHRISAWIAIVAMLALALVPTLSRAMAFADGNGRWAEVCTPQGMKLVSLAADTQDEGTAPAALSLDHCGFCSLTGDGAAPPPALAPTPLLKPHDTAAPAAFLHAPRTLHAWAAAQPRAPPSRA